MKGFILFIFLFSLYICQEEKIDNAQKALLIKTNLTKEELTQLLQTQSKNNNTSIEEVNPESESETEKILASIKNGKLKIKIKLELDLNKNEKTENEGENTNIESENNSVQTAFIQTSIPVIPQKISFFKYILALLISLILMSLFALSSHFKKKKKIILNKYNKKNDDYLLEDN